MSDQRTDAIAREAARLLETDRASDLMSAIAAAVDALGFGDAPLSLKYPFLNEITLTVAVSILFVSVKVFVTRNRIAP